ncbi:hypothetical protein DH2020_047536 [Rehmannia glutinosa]|uniref:Pectinesterase inhibitor domain-containing protein n=1 Tax=Rehmannia glutinosa TaxID=99300 RepID=A0ABR0U8F7_REHGL
MSRIKNNLAGNSISGEKTNRKKLYLSLLASILLVAAIIGVIAGAKSRNENSNHISSIKISPAHAIARSSCSSTLYPELCYSAIADSLDGGGGDKKVSSSKDVIVLSLNVTIAAVQRNYFAIQKLLVDGEGNLTAREKTALHDCLETIDETLDELHTAVSDLEVYPFKKSLRAHADDLKTLLSSAITNQETCLDGFSHSKNDKHEREVFVGGHVLRVEKLCSNSLAMLTNMTERDMENERKLNGGRKLAAAEGSDGAWPEWLSAGDRWLLQSSTVRPDVVVAADGSGNYRTVAAAVCCGGAGEE